MALAPTGFQERLNHAGTLLQRVAQIAAAAIARANNINDPIQS